jgi:hypothetical protein
VDKKKYLKHAAKKCRIKWKKLKRFLSEIDWNETVINHKKKGKK